MNKTYKRTDAVLQKLNIDLFEIQLIKFKKDELKWILANRALIQANHINHIGIERVTYQDGHAWAACAHTAQGSFRLAVDTDERKLEALLQFLMIG